MPDMQCLSIFYMWVMSQNDIQDKVKIKSKVAMENENNIIKILRSNESD